ncbi:hypothetical protein DFH11DRAFT_1726795 [Phellopilus nigrolimitatus]|nr:hypothetical protein DFH11DRAFT_1726795 [Phellopilus nigrolimitatus]
MSDLPCFEHGTHQPSSSGMVSAEQDRLVEAGCDGFPATAADLKAAKGRDLKYWANEINATHFRIRGRHDKPIRNVSNANKEELSKKLATYFSIDLNALPPPPPAFASPEDVKPQISITRDEEKMCQEQYDLMLDAYRDWGFQEPYDFLKKLARPSVQEPGRDLESLHATFLAGPVPSVTQQRNSASALTCTTRSSSPEAEPVEPSIAANSHILASIDIFIEGLDRASGLREAIGQGKRGEIQHYKDNVKGKGATFKHILRERREEEDR